jgi:hypothetical protein
MNAEVKSDMAILDRLKSLAAHRFTTAEEIQRIVQDAYELGLAKGRVEGIDAVGARLGFTS